ncbi:DUF427 domain-containing protein [Rhodococcus aerolatus]
MALTSGTGPLARPPQGHLNGDLWSFLPAHAVYVHPVHGRIRAVLDDVTVLDTCAAVLLHETRIPPVHYVPTAALDPALLEPSDTSTHCPFKGDAVYHHLRVGGHLVRDAVWSYPEPNPEVAVLADLSAVRFDAVDSWWEEDEQLHAGPRDPFHRVDVRRSSRHVVVRAGDTVLAESDRPTVLLETGYPARFYLPADDLRVDLTPTGTTTYCPYKGTASYASGAGVTDLAWSYPEPYDEAHGVAGLWCLDGEGVTTEVTPG